MDADFKFFDDNKAPSKQQIEGLKSIAERLSLEHFTLTINALRGFCLTDQQADLLISRFKLIKMGIL